MDEFDKARKRALKKIRGSVREQVSLNEVAGLKRDMGIPLSDYVALDKLMITQELQAILEAMFETYEESLDPRARSILYQNGTDLDSQFQTFLTFIQVAENVQATSQGKIILYIPHTNIQCTIDPGEMEWKH